MIEFMAVIRSTGSSNSKKRFELEIMLNDGANSRNDTWFYPSRAEALKDLDAIISESLA